MRFGKLFVLSAPSGAGKTSLVEKIIQECHPHCTIKQAITYTTRPPREGEIDGKHYYFISVDEFKEKIDQDYFIEWSTWYDHYYGSPVSILKYIEEGDSYIMVLDRSGTKEVLQAYPKAVSIWIEPPSIEELEKRLTKRGDNQNSIQNRLRKASVEIEQEKEEQFYKYHVINDNLKTAAQKLHTIFDKELKD